MRNGLDAIPEVDAFGCPCPILNRPHDAYSGLIEPQPAVRFKASDANFANVTGLDGQPSATANRFHIMIPSGSFVVLKSEVVRTCGRQLL